MTRYSVIEAKPFDRAITDLGARARSGIARFTPAANQPSPRWWEKTRRVAA
jgi:hypothetical protein